VDGAHPAGPVVESTAVRGPSAAFGFSMAADSVALVTLVPAG
jgi:hypothetical protein